MAKGYSLPIDYVLYDLSYANMIMYSAVLPSYNSKRDNKEQNQKTIKADDPRNRDAVRRFLENVE